MPIESESTRDGKPVTGPIESAVVRLKSAENAPATRDSSSRVEPGPSAKSTEQAVSAPSFSHASTGSEPMANELAALPGKPAVATLAGSSVADQLSESIAAWCARTPNEQGVRFELRLDPPELGRVVIRLQKSKGKVTARLLVTNEAARVTVERELPALQQSLEEAGVNLDEFDLSQHSEHRWDERPDDGRLPVVHWAQGAEAGTSPSTPVQTDGTAAGHVDLRV